MSEEISHRKELSIREAVEIATDYLAIQVVPMFWGDPGIGKSAIVKAIAKKFNLLLIDIRLATADPGDATGYPAVDPNTGKTVFFPPEWFPLEGEALPNGYKGWLIFFDEINQAVPAVQGAFFKILLDRMIGTKNLHKNVAMAAAGNFTTSGALANVMNTAMQSRLGHIPLSKDDVDGWQFWAEDEGIDHKLRSWVSFRDEVNNFSIDHTDFTYKCQRTIEYCDKLIKKKKWTDINISHKQHFAGLMGLGAAGDFVTYCEVYEFLPDFEEIKKRPDEVHVPDAPDQQHALSGKISTELNKDNIANVMIYILRMPVEFQVLALQGAIRNQPELMDCQAVIDWSIEHADTLVA
jgi:hypothetical protein